MVIFVARCQWPSSTCARNPHDGSTARWRRETTCDRRRDRDAFWIECTRFETGQPIHINIALVGSMSRDGERTVLTYVGDGQTIEVTETPEQILERHFGPMGKQ